MHKKIKKTKFSTYSEMIENLLNKNLSIGSRPLAIELLKSRGYYNLINRYKHEFYTDKNKSYPDNTSIMDLYLFHRMEDDLRNILFRFTINFEQRFKEAMAYTLAQNFGIYEADYLDPLKYRKNRRNKAISIMGEICEIAFKSNNNPTKYYRKNYDSIPPWIVLCNTSLGQARMWFSVFPTKLTDYVVSQLFPIDRFFNSDEENLYEFKTSLLSYEEEKKIKSDEEFDRKLREKFNIYIDLFKAMLNTIHAFRNNLAHGNRLVHFTTKRQLNLRPLRTFANEKVFSTNEYYEKNLAKNDLFSFMVSLMILLDKYDSLYLLDQLKSWKERNSIDPQMEHSFQKFIASCDLPKDFIERLSHISTEKVHQENSFNKLTDMGLYPKDRNYF